MGTLNLDDRSSPAPEQGAVASRQQACMGRRKEALRRRWQGEAPLRQVFWEEMLFAGTALNVATTLLALFLISAKAPVALAVVVFFATLPLNCFLVVAVWRSAGAASATTALAARLTSIAWFLAATML
jgi:hypothetical protein